MRSAKHPANEIILKVCGNMAGQHLLLPDQKSHNYQLIANDQVQANNHSRKYQACKQAHKQGESWVVIQTNKGIEAKVMSASHVL